MRCGKEIWIEVKQKKFGYNMIKLMFKRLKEQSPKIICNIQEKFGLNIKACKIKKGASFVMRKSNRLVQIDTITFYSGNSTQKSHQLY